MGSPHDRNRTDEYRLETLAVSRFYHSANHPICQNYVMQFLYLKRRRGNFHLWKIYVALNINMSNPESDKAYTNLAVNKILTAGRLAANEVFAANATINTLTIEDHALVHSATILDAEIDNADILDATIKNLNNETLGTATTNNGLQFNDIQQSIQLNDHRAFMLSNTLNALTAWAGPPAPNPLPMWSAGRTVSISNNTASTTLDIYVTEGYPNATGPVFVVTMAPGDPAFPWPIPTTAGWNGNFSAFPTGSSVVLSGATLAEFGFNQFWHGATPPLRETFDISTVPPGIGTLCSDGPHGFPPDTNNCVFYSRQSGFSTQQSFGYNIGVEIVPPAIVGPVLPAGVTVTCTQSNGDSPDSVGYPNDTAAPKQQTIDYSTTLGYMLNFLDPVVTIP
jgi:hypothetical protein